MSKKQELNDAISDLIYKNSLDKVIQVIMDIARNDDNIPVNIHNTKKVVAMDINITTVKKDKEI